MWVDAFHCFLNVFVALFAYFAHWACSVATSKLLRNGGCQAILGDAYDLLCNSCMRYEARQPFKQTWRNINWWMPLQIYIPQWLSFFCLFFSMNAVAKKYFSFFCLFHLFNLFSSFSFVCSHFSICSLHSFLFVLSALSNLSLVFLLSRLSAQALLFVSFYFFWMFHFCSSFSFVCAVCSLLFFNCSVCSLFSPMSVLVLLSVLFNMLFLFYLISWFISIQSIFFFSDLFDSSIYSFRFFPFLFIFTLLSI